FDGLGEAWPAAARFELLPPSSGSNSQVKPRSRSSTSFMTSFLFNGHEPSSFMLTEISRFRAGVFLASLGAMGVVTFARSASHFAASAHRLVCESRANRVLAN